MTTIEQFHPVRTGLRRSLAACALAVGIAVCAAGAAAADGTPYVTSDVQCDANANGVLDITLINDNSVDPAEFVVAAPGAASADIVVQPLSAHAVTLTDLADGTVRVDISINGVANPVVATVQCDTATVQVLGHHTRQRESSPALPATGSSATWGLLVGGVLVTAGIAASIVARRRYS